MHLIYDFYSIYDFCLIYNIYLLQISYFFLTVLGIELKTFIINEISSINDYINSRICLKMLSQLREFLHF